MLSNQEYPSKTMLRIEVFILETVRFVFLKDYRVIGEEGNRTEAEKG